jgi:soluble lytic murein transglycosylase
VENRKRLAITRTTPQQHAASMLASLAKGIRCCACVLALLILGAQPSQALQTARPAKKPAAKSAAGGKKSSATAAKKAAAGAETAESTEKQLTQLARSLRDDPNSTIYSALSAFATKNAKNDFGTRAALALGYYDISREKPELALGWLRKAVDDKLLVEYVQYWQAQTSLGLGQKKEGLEQLESFRRDFPQSVMTEQAVVALAQAAIAIGKPEDALEALNGLPNVLTKPNLLLLRAQANEKLAQAKGEKPLAAAADYLDLYYRFPLNDESKIAGSSIMSLQTALGETFPGTPLQVQIARVEALYAAHRWADAKYEYQAMLPNLSGVAHEHAELRIAQCIVQSGGKLELLTGLTPTNPDVDAERIYALSQQYRSQKDEAKMLEAVEQVVSRYPQSSWSEESLFATGNYYWVNVDRDHAADYYRRAVQAFPAGKYSMVASWRVAWIAYLERKPEAGDLIEAYVRQFPSGSYVQDALYWLGRLQERDGNLTLARGYYSAAATRFPLTYFGAKSAARLRPDAEGIGSAPADSPDVLSVIPPAPALPASDAALTESAQAREARARALSSIAFDASAELEYRAAYAETPSPELLVAAGQASAAAGHYAGGMAAIRQAFPQLEARRIPDIPINAWQTLFPLPYESSLRSAAVSSRVDPMLVAGVIRQESAFDANAKSHAGAIGLMQLIPPTALKLSRQMRIGYARARLTNPGYNLQLGSRYLAELIQSMGSPEQALAAYNAGEDRVAQWTDGQHYLEAAEFVESIPFTETRDYVQIVLRNADVYRQVYGSDKPDEVRTAALAGNPQDHAPAKRPVKSEIKR